MPLHTCNDLARDLRNLGVESGDILFVHSSFKSLGPVQGGVETVVRALEESIGAEGLLSDAFVQWEEGKTSMGSGDHTVHSRVDNRILSSVTRHLSLRAPLFLRSGPRERGREHSWPGISVRKGTNHRGTSSRGARLTGSTRPCTKPIRPMRNFSCSV